MPFEVALPATAKRAGWKVKIREKERLEPPHVTIMFKAEAWRLCLRDATFLVPPGGSWKPIPDEVRHAVESNWDALVRAWNAMYPENPVEDADDD